MEQTRTDGPSQSRRRFLATASAAAVVTVAGIPGTALARAAGMGAADKKLKVLFLGGTGMLGPHIVEPMLDAGHEVALFNRGNRDEMFPRAEQITGNRIVDIEPGLKPLEKMVKEGRRWDVVIDTSSVHTWTENSAKLLKDAADMYVFTSSMSVYADNSEPGVNESSPLSEMPDDVADTITTPRYNMQYFGAVKARCERAAEKHFPGRTLIVRPGLIVGPRDFSLRFAYWPWRVNRGGTVLAPGDPSHVLQFIDVRDLAEFIMMMIERKSVGIYNINGPVNGTMNMGKLLNTCKRVTGSDAEFEWADAEWLSQRGVFAWQQMPVWIPPVEGMKGFHQRDFSKAVEAGLKTRPLEDTVRDTLLWFENEYLPGFAEAMEERGEPERTFSFGDRRPGLTPEREKELLAELAAEEGGG